MIALAGAERLALGLTSDIDVVADVVAPYLRPHALERTKVAAQVDLVEQESPEVGDEAGVLAGALDRPGLPGGEGLVGPAGHQVVWGMTAVRETVPTSMIEMDGTRTVTV